MFGFIVYAGISFAAAVVLTILYIMTRKFELRDEARPGRVFVIGFILALAGPYILEEALTRTVGKSMKEAVTNSYDSAGFKGDMLYYKVIFFTGSSAKVLAIGEEKQDWGGMDHPIVSMNLVKKGNQWKVADSRIMISDRLDKDHIVYPPMW